MYKYYKCPAAIAERQRLTESRRKTDDGDYILNQADLITYPLADALADGATEITLEQAKDLLNKNN